MASSAVKGKDEESKGIIAKYNAALKSYPLVTKCTSGAIINASAEVLGQLIRASKGQQVPSAAERLKRMIAFGLWGFGGAAPLFHWWFMNLETITNSSEAVAKMGNTAKILYKIIIHQLMFGPSFLIANLMSLHMLQNGSPTAAWDNMKQIYFNALPTMLRIFTPVQVANLSVVPLDYRVLVTNFAGFMWNLYLALTT